MAKDTHALFHETWLGEVQPLEGLTFSVPVLVDGGVMQRLSAAEAREFNDYVTRAARADDHPDKQEGSAQLLDLRALLLGFCGWTEAELHAGEQLPDDLVLRIAEEGTELRPTLAIPHGANPNAADSEAPGEVAPTPLEAGEQTPASRAGAAYQLLAWELPPGLDLDASESETTDWHYPPSAKLERLLRETRVPIGLLSNGDALRLLYCPHGQATGWVTFHVDYMASTDGRDMLSALRELLHADRVMGGMPDTPTTLELLQQSRERQADVTTRLGEQVLEALQILLEGFEAAAARDGDAVLREAMHQAGNHVYEGLLTVMLRLIFALYAEDRALLPVEHPIYAGHLSVGGLYDALVADADAYGDTMEQRFGAWPRLIMLFRALYFGLEFRDPGKAPLDEHATLSMPPHRGRLFNPENYAFLEGCVPAGGAPVSPEDRASTRLPSISDGVIYRVLRRLLFLDGQRLSYGALEEEQLGSVYEGLMGYAIERRMTTSICLAPSRVWVSPAELLERPRATRVRWLQDLSVASAGAKRLAEAVEQVEDEHAGKGLNAAVLTKLREFSIAPTGRRAGRQRGREQLAAEVEPDRLVIQPGEERRRTSSHYTPRSLSGPIVARTLEPLLAAMRAKAARERPEEPDPQPTAEELLSLKICDPAMGSGAFLVEACRFLAKQVVAAWARRGELAAIVEESGDDTAKRKPEQLAMRMVAQRCVYGVDKNPLAVELGKLSLWLLTLARGQTFTFLDHCLKAGDSLVGLTKGQLLAMDWSVRDEDAAPAKKGKAQQAEAQLGFFDGQARRALDKATIARRKLAELAKRGHLDGVERHQHELHIEAERALERVRDVADILLSSYFFPYEEREKLAPKFLFDGKKISDKDRQACLRRVRDELSFWLQAADAPRLPKGLELRRELVRECIRPMHWEMEFPEVFSADRKEALADGGVGRVWVDAVIGNPPFVHGKGISTNFGPSYSEWLGMAYSANKNADISALFFRRAHWLLGQHGTSGLVATNTISQGDTRIAGLQILVDSGAQIYDAVTDLKWPVKGVNVSVSVVHIAIGKPGFSTSGCRLNGQDVAQINSQLRSSSERASPSNLEVNAGRSFVGSFVLGKGFVLTPEERASLIARNKRNAERMPPYVSGDDLNSSPSNTPSRYVIDFWDFDITKAMSWPDLFKIVEKDVKPDRSKQKRKMLRERWWQYADKRPGLYRAIRKHPRCLVRSTVSKHGVFLFQPTDRVFSHNTVVFDIQSYSAFGVLQSRIHEHWVARHSSSLETRQSYRPSDCFETFPFPDEHTLAETAPLESIAKRLYETRAAFMLVTDQGLTKTYNALKDPSDTTPEVEELRHLHEQLDRAVLDAYGQSQIAVPPYVGATPEQLERFEDQVLDFLFTRNAKLAAQEAKAQTRAKS